MLSRLHLRRWLGLGLTALALASASAPAQALDPGVVMTPEEQQVIASRGIGPRTPPVDAADVAPRVQQADAGFDWVAAGIGAAGAAAFIALVSLGAPALGGRRSVRTVR